MQVSLGPCHYGGADAATLTGVHPRRHGWVAVCARHVEQAERDGYQLRTTPDDACARATCGVEREQRTSHRPPARDSADPPPKEAYAVADDTRDLDVLDAMLDAPLQDT